MIQLGLFDPAPPVPTVADLLDRSWAPPAWPKGYACIYKATLIGTTRAYVGKAVDLRDRFRTHLLDDEYIDRALNAHGPENFSVEVLWVALSEAYAYAQEGSFIEAHRTRKAHGGYNIGEGGEGFTSADRKRWLKTPEGRAAHALNSALGGEVHARRAGYPMRRVLAELKKGPRTIASMASLLGFTGHQIRTSCYNLCDLGHHIIRECGGLYRLVTFEEAADHWACGRALTKLDRKLGLLMEGPRTMDELMSASGMPRKSSDACITRLRARGYNIENRGGHGRLPGTFHLIIDHKRHPWMHLHTMDLRGAAWDDRCNSVAN